MVAYVHENSVSYSWHESLMNLVAHDLARHGRVIRGGKLAMRCGTDGLVAARNKVVEGFLEQGAGWLLWVDTDMGFSPDAVDQLMAVADASERPMVGALCFAQRERVQDGMGGFRCTAHPTIFDWITAPDGKQGFQARASYPVNSVVRCSGTGSALILIHRSAFLRVRDKSGPTWYDRVPNGGQLISEDLSFCLRAMAVDVPLHVHTGVRSTHHKEFWLAEQDFWTRAVAPSATEEVAVLVPVMLRPRNAKPFMESLRASTGLATAYAITDADDHPTRDAWSSAGATLLTLERPDEPEDARSAGRPGTFAEKVNFGSLSTTEPWLFITGDDVRFHAGWLDHAQAMADASHHVVGTNDLANPRVLRGEHATHLLIRRRYVDEVGASWDGPGVVCHEGYGHWFVDDEIVSAARQRGAFSMALGAIVEHQHPLFGKAENDEVYELGHRSAKRDKQRFQDRMRVELERARARKPTPVAP